MAKKTTDIVPFTAETLAIAVDYTPFGEATSLSLTFSQVYNYIARPTRSGQKPSMADIMSFMKLCQSRQLNPYTGDAFLVGYDDSTKGAVFNLITSIHALFKRAEANEYYDGLESGLIVRRGGEVMDVEGAFYDDDDVLLGAWAKAFRKDRNRPQVNRIRRQSYDKGQSVWKSDPSGMLEKCAQAGALRKAFPNTLSQLYVAEEMQNGNVIESEFTPPAATPDAIEQEPVTATKSQQVVQTMKKKKKKKKPAAEPESPAEDEETADLENTPLDEGKPDPAAVVAGEYSPKNAKWYERFFDEIGATTNQKGVDEVMAKAKLTLDEAYLAALQLAADDQKVLMNEVGVE